MKINFVLDLDAEVEKSVKRLHKRGGRLSQRRLMEVKDLEYTRGFYRSGTHTAVILLQNMILDTPLAGVELAECMILNTIEEEALHYVLDKMTKGKLTGDQHHAGMRLIGEMRGMGHEE